jgi:exosortase/archaeosortase family protein
MQKPGLSAKKTFSSLFLLLVVILMVLPLATSFNEFLTRLVEDSSFYRPIQKLIVPYMSRLIVGLLSFLPGLKIGVFPYGVVVNGVDVRITWNCLGWQGFLLFFASCLIGLGGGYTKFSKGEAILFGFLGTFLVNLFRLVFTAALVGWWRGLFMILFHNYFSSFLTILWLFFFWWISYAYILETKEDIRKLGHQG